MPEDPLARLARDGLVQEAAAGPETTARWKAAMARAALRLHERGAPWGDLRLPVAAALVELYGDLPDAEVAALVDAVMPIAARGLEPLY
jgi:hypothetical protein